MVIKEFTIVNSLKVGVHVKGDLSCYRSIMLHKVLKKYYEYYLDLFMLVSAKHFLD